MFEERIAELNEQTGALPQPEYDKRVYTVGEIQDILGIGRNATYALVKKNLFRSVRLGANIRISKRSFDEWLDQQ